MVAVRGSSYPLARSLDEKNCKTVSVIKILKVRMEMGKHYKDVLSARGETEWTME